MYFVKFFIFLSVIAIVLAGCSERKVEYFNLNFIVTKDVPGQRGDPLPNSFKLLSNYYLNDNCSSKVFVPNVVFIRPDLDKETREELVAPLSSLNQFRKSLGLLSAVNLIEDYDTNISTLRSPAVLVEKSKKNIVVTDMPGSYPNAIIFKQERPGNEEIDNLRKQISDRLCINADISEMFLVFDASGTIKPPPQPSTTLSDDIRKENEKISLENPELRKKDAGLVVKSFEERVKDDPFGMYQLTKTIIYGKDHHEAFEQLGKAVRLAIGQGKNQQLIKLIDEDIKHDLTLDKSERTIWRLTTHPHDWTPIIKALMENDASLLEAEHDEKNKLKS